jgi:hypothetical protein
MLIFSSCRSGHCLGKSRRLAEAKSATPQAKNGQRFTPTTDLPD